MSNSLRFPSPWNSPGQNTGVGSLSLLQGIFPTKGWNPGLPHYRQILYQLSHQESLKILEWVAYPFSRGSSRPANPTGVSRIAGRFFTSRATKEAGISHKCNHKPCLEVKKKKKVKNRCSKNVPFLKQFLLISNGSNSHSDLLTVRQGAFKLLCTALFILS